MANTMYYALAGLSVVGLVLMVVVLAEPKSLFKVEDFDVGCGVFNCAPEGSPSDAEGAYGDRFRAMQAFGVLSVLTISATMVLHIIEAVGQEDLLPLQVRVTAKFVHIVSAVFLLVFWVVVVITYTVEADGVCPISAGYLSDARRMLDTYTNPNQYTTNSGVDLAKYTNGLDLSKYGIDISKYTSGANGYSTSNKYPTYNNPSLHKVSSMCILSDVMDLNYGLFFAVFVMLLEIGLFVLAHKAQATGGNVGFKTATQADTYHNMQQQ